MKAIASLLATFAIIAATSRGPATAQSFEVKFSQLTLDNGLRVVLSEDHSAPVVAVAVYYDVGSRNETKGRSGFAHLFEHMMFQGSENVRKAEHFKYVESNGGTLNASTHQDYTNYYEYLPSNQLELALWLESDRMRSLKITPENLKNQKEAVKEEKRLSYDNQAYWPALLKMDDMVFSNWANSHPTIGSMEDLDAATIDDVQRFFDIYYAPNNAVLVVAGDIEPSKAETVVRKYFASIPRQKEPPPVDVSEPIEAPEHKRIAEDQHADVPAVAIAWKIPSRSSPDFFALSLLKSLLSDGDSSRLRQKLVKQAAIAVEVTGTLEERRGPGQISVLVVHKANTTADSVLQLIESEIDLIKKDGISVDELNKIKNQYRLARFASGEEGEYSSLQTPLGRAMELAEFTLFEGNPALINSDINRYLAVTPEQIRDVARKYFGTQNRAVLFIRPAAKEKQP
jgi:zinc protease